MFIKGAFAGAFQPSRRAPIPLVRALAAVLSPVEIREVSWGFVMPACVLLSEDYTEASVSTKPTANLC